MGQKVNPHGLRVGIIKDWDSRWYAEKDFADNLVEDDKIRKYIKNRLYSAVRESYFLPSCNEILYAENYEKRCIRY